MYVLNKNKNIKKFSTENLIFYNIGKISILHGHVFVMEHVFV